MAGKANSINEGTTGICGFDGTSFTATPATNHAVQVGGATSSTLTNLGLGTTGQILTSNGASSDPSFQTNVFNSNGYFGLASALTNKTGDGTTYNIIYDVTKFQNGTDITFSAGTFTVNTTGVYLLCWLLSVNNLAIGNTSLFAYLTNGSDNGIVIADNPGIHLETTIFNDATSYFSSGVFSFTASDTFTCNVQVSGGTQIVGLGGQAGSPSFGFSNYLTYARVA